MKTKRVVGLVQVNSGFSGQHYFPYSVGILQAYAEKHLPDPERFEFLLPVYRRIKVTEAADQLETADLVAFSTYVWNIRLSLAIAAELKRRRPEILVIFGGPQVPRYDRPWEIEEFFTRNPFVDIAVHGAGEPPFTTALEHGFTGNWGAIPSSSFRLQNPLFQTYETEAQVMKPFADVTFRQTGLAPSFKDLAEVPSPYLNGTFDGLMKANPKEKWIVLWETDRNCPFSCTFCGWGLLEKKPIYRPLEQVFQEVDWFADNKIEFVFCANANFFLTRRDLDIARYVVQAKERAGYPQRLSVQDSKNRPDEVFEGRMILEKAGLNTGVIISLQSVDPQTLEIVRRNNIKLDAYRELQRRFRIAGIETMTDIILPLAGQSYDSFAEGISEIIAHGQHNRINLNLCCVVPDAEMSHREYMAKYGLKTVTTRTVNVHGQIENEEVPETQDLVIATAAMPGKNWIRALVYMWNVQFLYFNKLLQIPIVIVRECAGISYREIIEFFSESRFGSAEEFPIFAEIQKFFRAKAKDLQCGGTEYVHSPEWLDMYWQAYEYVIIDLAINGKLEAFYRETERALTSLIAERGVSVPDTALSDAIRLNQGLLKQPFQTHDLTIDLSWNIWDFYQGVIGGNPISLEEGAFQTHIDRTNKSVRGANNWWGSWDEWCREVIWFGYKRGAFFYGATALGQTEPAGHR